MSISIRQLAKRTGVSTATVSMALRGVGRVSKETREMVQQVANELGYTCSPLISKALSLARQKDHIQYRETIALITEFPPHKAPLFQQGLFEATSRRAHELGLKIEEFIASDRPSEQRRLSGILRARGIRGVVILPRVLRRAARLLLDWKHFIPLEIGRTVLHPLNLHRVERSIYHELIEALHLLKKAGYRRIGLAIDPHEDSSRWGIYTAAFLMYQQRVPESRRLPPLASCGKWTKATMQMWLKTYSPDVIIIHNDEWLLSWLEELGVAIPTDLSIFSANVGDTKMAGLRPNITMLGETAVETLSILLNKNQLGLQMCPRCTLVRDYWQQGNSLKLPLPVSEKKTPTATARSTRLSGKQN